MNGQYQSQLPSPGRVDPESGRSSRGQQKNRTEIVKEALQEYLDDIEGDEKFKEAVVELYLNDQIRFEVLKEFIGRQDAESVRASKTILDQGEDLADDLAGL